MRVALFVTLTVYYIFSFILLLQANYSEVLKKHHVRAKLSTSVGFIVIATVGAIFWGDMELFKRMLPAFILCMVGDLFLALFGVKDKNLHFIVGLLAFLLGHVGFVIALDIVVPFSPYELIIPIISVIATIFLLKLKNMEAANMKPYILIYSFFVAWLLSKGVMVLFASVNKFSLTLFFGAVLFFISDLIILFLIFYKKKYKPTVFFNLLTYYMAQYLLAISIFIKA